MSALAMILTGAMVVLGDGPEKVSGEVAKTQRLDLRGRWEGSWTDENGTIFHATTCGDDKLIGTTPLRLKGGCIEGEITFLKLSDVSDQGNGKLRGKWWFSEDGESPGWYQGIYRQEGDRLTICFRNRPHPRPISFHAGDGQHLLILKRVKSRK
jgi:hypothetical protein